MNNGTSFLSAGLRRVRPLAVFLLALAMAAVFMGGRAAADDPATHTAKTASVSAADAATALPCDIYASGGTPCIAAHSTTRALFVLDALFVEPEHWRKGVGRVLIGDVCRMAAARGGGRLQTVANPPAEGFYERLGFRALGNATRRAICDALKDLPRTTGQLCGLFPELDRCTVMQHLKVLEAAGLVVAAKKGRERFNYLDAMPIAEIHRRWIRPHAAKAADGLLALKDALESERVVV